MFLEVIIGFGEPVCSKEYTLRVLNTFIFRLTKVDQRVVKNLKNLKSVFTP